MSTCGDFQLQGAIGWGRHATFFAGFAAWMPGEATLAIRRARAAEFGLTQSSLRAAAEQEAAVKAGCRRLAPILGFGLDEGGCAYYATLRYPVSLADLLEADCAVDAEQLHVLVSGVLSGLDELQQKCRRPHGKLTAGNVLLDAQERPVLTDLAPTARDLTPAADLVALGTLIYQLVRGAARVGYLSPPLDFTQEWADRLGDAAEGWLTFTNLLLARDRHQGPNAIEQALDDLKRIDKLVAPAPPIPVTTSAGGQVAAPVSSPQRVRRRSKTGRNVTVAVLAVALLGGGAFFWKKQADEKDRERLARIEAEKAAAAGDPLTKALRESFKDGIPPGFAADGKLQQVSEKIVALLKNRVTETQIEAELREWSVPRQLGERAQTWQEPPFSAFAPELASTAELKISPESDLLLQLKNALAAHLQAGAFEREWKKVGATLAEINRARIPELPDFTPWAIGEVAAAGFVSDAPKRAAEVNQKLQAVRSFAEEDLNSRVMLVRFREEDVFDLPTVEVRANWPDTWLRTARGYLRPPASKVAEWEQKLRQVEPRIATRPPAERPRWQGRLASARTLVREALATEVRDVEKELKQFDALRDPMEEAHEKYVALLEKLKNAASDAARKDDAQKSLTDFEAGAAQLLARYRTYAQLDALRKNLRDGLATPDQISLEFTNPNWKLERAGTDFAIYTYGGRLRIPFLSVPGQSIAMAAVETPLELLSVAGRAPERNPGDGVRPWTGSAAAPIAPQASWLWPKANQLISEYSSQFGSLNYFAQNVAPGDQGMAIPVTWVRADEAVQLAATLGGRLPTSKEWTAAHARAGQQRRLRSSAFTRQTAHIDAAIKRTGSPGFASAKPDTGSFSKTPGLPGNAEYMRDTAADPSAMDDGALWFTSVYGGRGTREWPAAADPREFVHLIGNAAEWVVDGATASIAGGSVLSSRVLPTNTPLRHPMPMPRPPGYADVTFRLAVPLGPGGEGAGLAAFKKLAAETAPPALPATP